MVAHGLCSSRLLILDAGPTETIVEFHELYDGRCIHELECGIRRDNKITYLLKLEAGSLDHLGKEHVLRQDVDPHG